ncbi:TetR/AcrR family transcriptional regulator [Nocardia acidivorans]|uniref:TetR/AcrR family transcriptional regulator n=1 Tax=Nocardia acidivorans TaxID=404580 RepID=UPI000833A74C|nr:TetR/AcrR family transcriptional regulator [Nocardia acidivorans]
MPEETTPPGPLIWTLPEPPGRPTTTLNRADILRAALAIADAEGASALTMRRVATAVGASTPMSLYRYVGSKDGLVDLMIDAVYGEIPLPRTVSAWRPTLERLSLDTWAVIQRHLWFGHLVHTRPPFGPNALRYFDFRFALLETLGISADDMTRITAAIDGHLIGTALQLAEEMRMRSRTGLYTEAQLGEAAASFLQPIVDSGSHPAFARWVVGRSVVVGRGVSDGADAVDPGESVAWTLAALLDGITDRLELPGPS